MARFAQEIFANSQKRSRAKYKTAHNVVELEGPIAEPAAMREEIKEVVRGGLERALKAMAEEVSDRAPSSRDSGSQSKWSSKVAANMARRMTLKDGVRWRVFEEDGNQVGEIYLDEKVEYIGRFVEYGHALVLWGHDTDQTLPPQPFMRAAYESGREGLVSDTAKGTKEALR